MKTFLTERRCGSTGDHRRLLGAERQHDERRQLGQWLDGRSAGWAAMVGCGHRFCWRRRRRRYRVALHARRQVTRGGFCAGCVTRYRVVRRSRRALVMTATELRLMASAAIMGDRSWPVNG